MRIHLIYPSWRKLERQTEFHLPPHGPVVFAAQVPPDVDLVFTDENRQEVVFDPGADLAALSVMLTCQLPRAFAIADRYREMGVPVLFGGIATMLHAQEAALHADSIFLGEVEGRFSQVLKDLSDRGMRKVYDFMEDPPPIGAVGSARRSILDRSLYTYRGLPMVDLVHASRGCRFNCFPCCARFLGGRKFRPRPIEKVVEEIASIPNNRLFLVDNSLSQDRRWLVELLTALEPLKKVWVSHPVLDDPEILSLAAQAGCWYVYQAVFDTSDFIRERIRRLKDHGIGVEGTIILGTDDQDEDGVKRLVGFLLEVDLDVAEFTILTPFPHSPIRAQLEKEGRILPRPWEDYTADRVVFTPRRMSPDRLQELYYWAWDHFYRERSANLRMGELFLKAVEREKRNGTYHRPPRRGAAT